MLEWQVQQLRLTGFPGPGKQFEGKSWWEEVVGTPPESETTKPRIAHRYFRGPVEWASKIAGRLDLTLLPGRVDWVLTAADDAESESASIDTLGAFEVVVSEFSGLAGKWFSLSECPPMQRLAFGATLVKPVLDRSEGYRLLSELLPSIELDAGGSSDFLYQINRPRENVSKLLGMKVNRLSTWAVVRTMRAEVSLSASHAQAELRGPGAFACRLVLDINTPAEDKNDIGREHLEGVFGELVGLGREIAKEGDVP